MSTMHVKAVETNSGNPAAKIQFLCLEEPCVKYKVKIAAAFLDNHTLVHYADHIDVVV